jgi:hypothetical protein
VDWIHLDSSGQIPEADCCKYDNGPFINGWIFHNYLGYSYTAKDSASQAEMVYLIFA